MGGRPLEGEHDCRLTLPLETGSTEEERALGAPGLPLVAESGLSGSEVLKLGGASREKPGISEGFHGLDFTVGELARGGGFLAVAVGPGLVTGGGDLTGGVDVFDIAERVVGLRVGVGALDVGLDDAGKVGLEVGVEDLAVVLDKGVVDLGGAAGLLEVNVDLEVGVEDLEGLGAEVDVGLEAVADVDLGAAFSVGLADEDNVGRPVGVAGLDPGPPEDEGLRIPALELFNPGDGADCLDDKLLREAGSGWGFASYNHIKQMIEREINRLSRYKQLTTKLRTLNQQIEQIQTNYNKVNLLNWMQHLIRSRNYGH